MEVRAARPGDERRLAELNALVQEMHRQVAPSWFKPPEIEAIAGYFADLLGSDEAHVFVAEVDGAIVGYALARAHVIPATVLTYRAVVVELDQIGVEPGHRGRGVGTMLLGRVRELARECRADRLQLTVWEFNVDARRLFERAGFSTTMRRMLADPV